MFLNFYTFDNLLLCSICDITLLRGLLILVKFSICYAGMFWFSSFSRYTIYSNSYIKRYINLMHIIIKNMNFLMLCLVCPSSKWHSGDRESCDDFSSPCKEFRG